MKFLDKISFSLETGQYESIPGVSRRILVGRLETLLNLPLTARCYVCTLWFNKRHPKCHPVPQHTASGVNESDISGKRNRFWCT